MRGIRSAKVTIKENVGAVVSRCAWSSRIASRANPRNFATGRRLTSHEPRGAAPQAVAQANSVLLRILTPSENNSLALTYAHTHSSVASRRRSWSCTQSPSSGTLENTRVRRLFLHPIRSGTQRRSKRLQDEWPSTKVSRVENGSGGTPC